MVKRCCAEIPRTITTLKIDKSFVQAVSVRHASIVSTIITLGHSLGLRVVAEGVETAEQLEYLSSQGCDEVQGFYFSKPIPADDFARLLTEGLPIPGRPGALRAVKPMVAQGSRAIS